MIYFQKAVLLGMVVFAFGWLAPVSGKTLLVAGNTITEKDKIAIREVIQKQLEAFQRDDGETAFSLASPGIQQVFRTPQIFLRMVKTSYYAVYRPQKVDFLSLELTEGNPVQILQITGPNGVVYKALYPMEFQAKDQTWKTAGCYLFPTKSVAI